MPRLKEIVDTNKLQRAADGAVPFERNEFMERLIEMRVTRPKSFAGMSPASKLALGHYEAAKRRAQMLASDV
jgi:hypothetical protein